MHDLKTSPDSRPPIRVLAAAAAALALASAASTAAADPVTACAPASGGWDRAAASGDVAAMRSAMHAIPAVCTQLLARAHARLSAAEVGPRRSARIERPPEGPPAAERTGSVSDALNQVEMELVSQGAVAWEGFAHDSNPPSGYEANWTYQKRAEATNFSYDLNSCDFDYHFKVTVDGKVSSDDDVGVPLRNLTTIRVANLAELIKVRDAQAGHPTYSSRLQPTIYAVEAIRADGQFNEFDFYSLETARRVGRLLEAAASRCGANPVVRY